METTPVTPLHPAQHVITVVMDYDPNDAALAETARHLASRLLSYARHPQYSAVVTAVTVQ